MFRIFVHARLALIAVDWPAPETAMRMGFRTGLLGRPTHVQDLTVLGEQIGLTLLELEDF